MADTSSTSAENMPDDLAQRIGCDTIIVAPFDHGGFIGVLAKWGDISHAVRITSSGRRPHRSNPDWVASYPLPEDYQKAVEELRAWRTAQVSEAN